MSPLRTALFVASILLCLVLVLVFLWAIPCSDGHTCPAEADRVRTKNWLRQYERIELKGGINVVDGLAGRSKNLVFMYRGDKMWSSDPAASTSNQQHRKHNGIISLMGSSGQVSWFDEIVNEPRVIDCGLLDADRNGIADCLVLDDIGELGCIDPLSGQWIWRIVARTVRNAELLSFPLVLPDLNKDGVNELLVTTNGDRELYNQLIIVCGATGRTLGTKYALTECSYIHKFQLDAHHKVSFNCIHNDTEKQIVKSLDDLYRLITNKSTNIVPEPKGRTSKQQPAIAQHKFYGQRKDTMNQRNIYAVAGKQLIVENSGKCPDDCNVTVQLIEQKGGKEHVVRNFTGPRMYGMVPALLSFNASQANGRQAIHGFVIKFWEWGLNETDVRYQARHRRSTFPQGSDEFNRFGHLLHRKRAWSPTGNDPVFVRRRKERSPNETTSSDFSEDNVHRSTMRLIKETVVLVVFNSTDTRIENTSQSNIVQFCRKDEAAPSPSGAAAAASASVVSCQPDLNYQENSVMIADLDEDGSQELVTYYTTFVNEGDDAQMDWKLVTFVQLLRLEAELPKLYVVDGQK